MITNLVLFVVLGILRITLLLGLSLILTEFIDPSLIVDQAIKVIASVLLICGILLRTGYTGSDLLSLGICIVRLSSPHSDYHMASRGRHRGPDSGGSRTPTRRVRDKENIFDDPLPPRPGPSGIKRRALGLSLQSNGVRQTGRTEAVPKRVNRSTKGKRGEEKKTRNKPGHIFFITVGLPELYDSVYRDFIKNFTNLTSYAVTVETSRKSSLVSYHIHSFLEFAEPVLCANLSEYLHCVYPDIHVDCQPCHSRRTTLKYITKEASICHTNIRESEFHFYYRAHCWARRTVNFRFNDPFVVEHRFTWNFLRQLHKDTRAALAAPVNLRPMVRAYRNWSHKVAVWWNSAIFSWTHKRKCLYLHGNSNTGKTSFIESCIGRSNMHSVFYPGAGRFFMSDFNSDIHKVIVFEEFESKYHIIGMLKRLLEGKTFSYPVKCSPSLVMAFRGPIIFITNEPFDMDDAMANRLLCVSATRPYWQDDAVPVAEVKSEDTVDETPYETIELSSEEEVQSSQD